MPPRPRRRPRRVAVAGSALLAPLSVVAMATSPLAGASQNGRGRPAGLLASIGTVPLVPSGTVRLGAVPGNQTMRFDVALQPTDPKGLAAFVSAVSTPGSTSYHQYLTPSGFAKRFGAARSSIAAVVDLIRSDGLRVVGVASNGLSVQVSGRSSRVAPALGTSFARFRLSSGRIGFANLSAPRLPAAVAARVEAVVGLSTLATMHPEALGSTRSLSAARRVTSAPTPTKLKSLVAAMAAPYLSLVTAPKPCSAVKALASGSAFSADQLAAEYGFTKLYQAGDLGQGQTVALFELERKSPTDIAAYQACYGTSTTVNYINVDNGPGTAPPVGESVLDIESVIGLAPGTTIDVYQGPNNNFGPYDVYRRMITDDKAKVISTSWGICEAQVGGRSAAEAERTLFEEAATQGQTIVAASGDDGSTDCTNQSGQPLSRLAVDDPGSQAYVTSVGGVRTPKSGGVTALSAWNNGSGASGGGISALWPMPAYQTHAPSSLNVVNKHSSGTPCAVSGGFCREAPDVSADASTASPVIIHFSLHGGWITVGGTSVAAPIWGAFAALANASTGCAGKPVGFLNPGLYAIAGSSAYSQAFDDVTRGNNDWISSPYTGGLFPAGRGFDMATGLGTPLATATTGVGLARRLCTGSPPAKPDVLRISPSSGPQTGGTWVTITGWGYSKVTAVTFGSARAKFDVVSTTEIVAIAPKGTGRVHVTVTADSRTSAWSTADRFTYN